MILLVKHHLSLQNGQSFLVHCRPISCGLAGLGQCSHLCWLSSSLSSFVFSLSLIYQLHHHYCSPNQQYWQHPHNTSYLGAFFHLHISLCKQFPALGKPQELVTDSSFLFLVGICIFLLHQGREGDVWGGGGSLGCIWLPLSVSVCMCSHTF